MFFSFWAASMDLVMVFTLTPLLAIELKRSLTWPLTDIS